jgi:hypothetical protein
MARRIVIANALATTMVTVVFVAPHDHDLLFQSPNCRRGVGKQLVR